MNPNIIKDKWILETTAIFICRIQNVSIICNPVNLKQNIQYAN